MERVQQPIAAGVKFGRWTVMGRAEDRRHWRCECECGEERVVSAANLRAGTSQSCGCLRRELQHGNQNNRRHGAAPSPFRGKPINLVGQTYGRLLVIDYKGRQRWLCRCECGAETIVVRTSLVKGRTRSCGCLNIELTAARSMKNLAGQRFERLLVEGKAEHARRGKVAWACLCDCGKRVIVTTEALTTGHTRSCGCIRIAKLQGKKFDRLTVEAIVFIDGKPRWRCRCDCGKACVASTNALRFKRIRSCGCLRLEHLQTMENVGGHPIHGYTGVRGSEYTVWTGMKQRCLNPNSESYPRYGGRGVTVCQRWRDSFLAFLEDVGSRPTPQHTLDRFPDTNGNYEPGNVRWATRLEQAQNKALSAPRVAKILDEMLAESADLLERAVLLRVRQRLLGR